MEISSRALTTVSGKRVFTFSSSSSDILNRLYQGTSFPPLCYKTVLSVVLLFVVTGCTLVAENTVYTPSTAPFPIATVIVPTETAAFSCIPQASPQGAYVTKVVDGDTIWVMADGQSYKVRYIGVDTPEIGVPGADEATDLNYDLVFGKKVMLYKDVSETDKYGRLLRYVVAEGKFVNYELVSQGVAKAGTWQPDTACGEFLKRASPLTSQEIYPDSEK